MNGFSRESVKCTERFTMKLELDHEDLISLVCGCPAPSDVDEPQYVYFSGNQWNTMWDWDRHKLKGLSNAELYELYIKHKGAYY